MYVMGLGNYETCMVSYKISKHKKEVKKGKGKIFYKVFGKL